MIDAITQKPVEVWAHQDAKPLIVLPESQLEQLRTILDELGVRYWVDDEVLEVDDKPAIAFIILDRKTDPVRVQAKINSVP